MKEIITVAAVNFSAEWGNKQLNKSRIEGYIESAAKRGVDMIVFPEQALTGYDMDEPGKDKREAMHFVNAETIKEKTVTDIANLTKKLGVYAVFGMPERDMDNPDTVYNSAIVSGPEGFVMSYRKRNLPNDEMTWAVPGVSSTMFDTPWGPVGIGICADVYDFPEFSRYARAKGARLYVNPTAMPAFVAPEYPRTAIEVMAASCCMYVVSADLYGQDRLNEMMGGTNIVGPGDQKSDYRQWIHYYAGHPFGTEGSKENYMAIATLDLTLGTRSYMNRLWDENNPQFNPKEFIELYKSLG